MSKIEPRFTPQAVPSSARVERIEPSSTAPAGVPGDSLHVSDTVRTAERMRAIIQEVEAWMAFRPRTTQQANDWLEQGRTLYAEASPRLKNGDLRSLPLKERQVYTVGLRRFERFLEDAPGLLRHFKGE